MKGIDRVGVIGGGAMGCLFGGRLREAGCSVALVDAEPETARTIAGRGVIMEDSGGARTVAGLDASIAYEVLRGVPLILICVKSGSTARVAAACAGVAGNALVLTLQNGLGNVEALCAGLGRERVAAGTTRCGAASLGSGHIRVAGIGETVIGELDGAVTERIRAVCDLFNRAGLPARISPSITDALWTKLLANAGINAIAALTGLKNGEIPLDSEAAALMNAAVLEAAAVARASGAVLEVGDPVAHVRNVAAMTAENDASMLQDVRMKRQTEIDAINGEIVRRGREVGVPTTVNAILTLLVRLRQRGYGNI